MEIHFLGVGEACDGDQPNTSMLVKAADDELTGRILLDCGFSVPHHYFSLTPTPEELEIVWISHFHGDHFLGMPLMLLWFWEMNRTAPLHIIGPPGIEVTITRAMELAYPNFLPRINFPLLFHELTPAIGLQLSDSTWTGAFNEHSQPCLSLRLVTDSKKVFYSGDGRPTEATRSLAAQCDIIIHEAYGYEDTTPGHGSVSSCLDFARRAGTRRIALVHLQRDVRKHCNSSINELRNKYPDLELILPEKGTRLII